MRTAPKPLVDVEEGDRMQLPVKELMIPLEEYATVSEGATLWEAVIALDEARKKFQTAREGHLCVLVLDARGRVVGMVDQWDVVRGMEPKYDRLKELHDTSRYGFSPEYLRSMLEEHGLWRKPLDDLCKKASEMSVSDFMHSPTDGEYVEENVTLDHAVHLLVMGRHRSLLVTKGTDGEIVGVLRLCDVFNLICRKIRECRI